MLARAVAGEAGVPFFAISASEFVEVFAGLGAARVRSLFEAAKAAAPSIIFIDEIDAIGRQRGSGLLSFFGGAGEREQTLNQLLDSLDGYETNAGVVVLAATNRPDILDSALVRPGRFDRTVTLELPDLAAREAILRVISSKLRMGPDADVGLSRLARQSTGFSGADLRAVLNEAAIAAASREGGEARISAADLAEALDRKVLGLRKIGVSSDRRGGDGNGLTPAAATARTVAATHEAGRAIVASLMPESDEVTSVSILPRAGAGGRGATTFLPSEDRLVAGLYSRNYLLGRMSAALGGLAAEEVRFGPSGVTSSSASDLLAVSSLAHALVEQTGLSHRFRHAALLRGARADAEAAYTGGAAAAASVQPALQTLNEADDEVRAVVEEAYRRAKGVLEANRGALEEVVGRLLEEETVDGADLAEVLARHGAALVTGLKLTAEDE